MLYKIQILFFIILFFASTGSSQNEVPKADYSLIFETEFEYILEDREHVNFQKVSNLNDVADGKTIAKIWKQDLSINPQPELYLADLLEQKIIKEGAIKYELHPNWLSKNSKSNQDLFSTVDTSENIAETGTIHGYMRTWTNYIITQRWYFQENSKTLSNEIIAISPVFRIRKKIEGDTTIWFKEERIKIDVNNTKNKSLKVLFEEQDIIWMKQITTDVSFKNIRIIKGDAKKLQQVLWDDIFDLKKQAFAENIERQQALNPSDLSHMMTSRIDTITLFDPDTYEERITIATYTPPTFATLPAYRIDQVWYFDDRTNQLHSQLLSIAPLVRNHFNEELEVLFYILPN